MDRWPILSAVSRFRPGLVPQEPSMSSVANVITCLYNYETTGVPTDFGIRAGLTVGNPCYRSMLSLVFENLFEKLQTICENSE